MNFKSQTELNGTTVFTYTEAQGVSDDQTTNDKAQRQAQAQQMMLDAEANLRRIQDDGHYQSLSPTEKRIFIEHKYLPMLEQAEKAHITACDAVEDFQNGEQLYRTNLAANYAYTGQHPEVRKIVSNGQHHFNSLLSSGELTRDGYKLLEQRGSVSGTTTLICVPVAVPDLMHYANTEECTAMTGARYKNELESLILTRNKAAIALTACQAEAERAWSSIKDITSFFSKVKSSKK